LVRGVFVAELDRDKQGAANGPMLGRPLPVDAEAGTDDTTSSMEKQSDHPCFECVLCCSYVAIEIDTPTTMKEYDYIVWYLYHQGVSIFVDWEGAWYIKFEARCEHLTPLGLCDSYSSRPIICKEFDWRECENRLTSEPADKWLFETDDQFLRWFEKKRPKTFRRFQKYMRKKHRNGEEKELGRVKITQLLPPPTGR
jgi:Fe-S-cluster containining protein